MGLEKECKKKGHFQNAKICPKRKSKAAVGRVEGVLSETDTDSVGKVMETVKEEIVRKI